jgi:hypothetical protein
VALNQDFPFDYQFEPVISVRILSHDTQRQSLALAQIDTGAAHCLFDTQIAADLGIDLALASVRYVSGIEGRPIAARLADVELRLLDEPELSVFTSVTFLPGVFDSVGNLIGLDVLSQFDLGLQHGLQRGTLGVTQR